MAQSFAIVGAGAVGAFYGALLQRAGFDVHFLVRSGAAEIQAHGIRIGNAQAEPWHVHPVKVYESYAAMPACDHVIVAVKTTENYLLPEILRKVAKPDATIVMMQNGIGNEERIGKHFPQKTIVAAVTYIGATKEGPGRVFLSYPGKVILAEFISKDLPTKPSPRLEELFAALTKSGADCSLGEDYLAARFRKLLWNVPFNGLAVVLATTTDCLVKNPATLELVKTLMQEVLAIAASHGRVFQADEAERVLRHTSPDIAYRPSMKVDYDEGRPLEVVYIYENLLTLALHTKTPSPSLRMLWQLLTFTAAQRQEPHGNG